MRTVHGMCPPGYEKVRSYTKDDRTHVDEYCRRIKVKGRSKTLASGMYNEAMIAQEDLRLGFDTMVDTPQSGMKNISKIQQRTQKLDDLMKEQMQRKNEAKEKEDGGKKLSEPKTRRKAIS
jgi:uncharacterized membrane protein YkoI